ncbi:hypothetical protein CFOL_v3_23472 [Cephalotus follicularis]|uniref:Uncharacterized protein n=1 Tax=Cephalotus follicularis TaxID=3775 RepID=A0A1Q3CID4_CEPFO|nr:hypothetical protein CFOL_v3_23472 [Cephalotus follicularis]
MEDQSVEWQIEDNNGKVSWVLKKGVTLGKRILVTGFVISSATLFLPPLVVISVMGFACSIPYGVFLASYACTEKLMNKLLPMATPAAPLLLDFGTVNTCDDVRIECENEGFGDERQQLADDTGGGVDEGDMLDYFYESVAAKKYLKDSVEIVKECYIGESLDEKDDTPLENSGVLIEGVIKGEEEEHAIGEEVTRVVIGIDINEENRLNVKEDDTPIEVTRIIVESYQDSDIKEEEKLMRETRGLLEQLGDRNVYENARMDKQIREFGKGGEICDREIAKESAERKDTGQRASADTGGLLETNIGVLETDKFVAELGGTINAGSIAEANQDPMVNKAPMLLGESAEENGANDKEPDFQLNWENQILVPSNADARWIADESGFELFDGKNEAGWPHSFANFDTGEESEQLSSKTTYHADVMELSVSVGENEPRSPAIVSDKVISMASNKVLYNEEKLWERIDAMRKIVGYKGTLHATCIEELKALYLFAGIEPPATFKDPSDLVEINEKLLFLMSIVGVK